jgi:hypothetical protein
MAEDTKGQSDKDKAAKDKIAKGMAETGKEAATHKEAGTGATGTDEMTKGMSEAGRHPARGAEELSDTARSSDSGGASRTSR